MTDHAGLLPDTGADMTIIALSAHGAVDHPQFGSPGSFRHLGRTLSGVVGPGWIVHRVDDELAVATLMRGDGGYRNHHAEAVLRRLGITPTPMLYGTVAVLGVVDGAAESAWGGLGELDGFHAELLDQAHAEVVHQVAAG